MTIPRTTTLDSHLNLIRKVGAKTLFWLYRSAFFLTTLNLEKLAQTEAGN